MSPIGRSKRHAASDHVVVNSLRILEALIARAFPKKPGQRGVESNRPDLSIVDGFGVASAYAIVQQDLTIAARTLVGALRPVACRPYGLRSESPASEQANERKDRQENAEGNAQPSSGKCINALYCSCYRSRRYDYRDGHRPLPDGNLVLPVRGRTLIWLPHEVGSQHKKGGHHRYQQQYEADEQPCGTT